MKPTVKFIVVFMALILSSGTGLHAASIHDIFFKANKQYDNGNYKKAAALYEDIISQGIRSGNLYYNLGNAYFKLGRKGKAILNYERARKLIPHNEDLFANMSFVKSVLNVKQPQEVYPIYQKILIGLRDVFSTEAWFFLCIVSFFIGCFLLGAGFLSDLFRRRLYVTSCIFIIFSVISLFFFTGSYNAKEHFKTGIIVNPKAEVRYSPSYSGAVAFEIIEGMRAQIIRRKGEWTHIRLNREKSGWVESEAIEKI